MIRPLLAKPGCGQAALGENKGVVRWLLREQGCSEVASGTRNRVSQ